LNHDSQFSEQLFLESGQGEVMFYLQKVDKHWHGRKGWEKESTDVYR
jgi:hypothetical protein